MKKNLRKYVALFMVVALLMCLAVTALAAEQYIYDFSSLFSDSDKAALESKAIELSEQTDMDLVILTTSNAQGKTSMQLADDFYDGNALGRGSERSGAVFLIDMDNREIYISTSGMTIRYLTDERIERILDNAYSFITQENYAGAADVFLQNVAQYVAQGISNDQYNYDTETGEISRHRSVSPLQIALFALISLGAGGAACLVVKGRYQMKAPQYAYPAQEKSGIALTAQADDFVNQTVITRQIPRTPPPSSGGSSFGGGGGRSSTHRSSSGRSHGGGGRKF